MKLKITPLLHICIRNLHTYLFSKKKLPRGANHELEGVFLNLMQNSVDPPSPYELPIGRPSYNMAFKRLQPGLQKNYILYA